MSTYWRIFEFPENGFCGSWVQCCSAAPCWSVSKTESGLELLNLVQIFARFNAFLSAICCLKQEKLYGT